jgi:hypothetical protein
MPANFTFDRTVVQNTCEAIGVDLIETNDAGFLLNAAKKMFEP